MDLGETRIRKFRCRNVNAAVRANTLAPRLPRAHFAPI